MSSNYVMLPALLFVTIGVIVAGIYDLVLVAVSWWKGEKVSRSISNMMISVGFTAVFTVYVWGFVSGHLFGYMYPEHCPESMFAQRAMTAGCGAVFGYITGKFIEAVIRHYGRKA